MNPRKIIFLLMIFILALATPVLARGGGGGRSGGHGGWSGHSGGYYGRGYYGGGFHYHPRAYWGPSLYFGYWGWPYYYPPAYYYYPAPDYYPPPPPVYAPPSSGEVTPPPTGESQVYIYPRKGQSPEQQAKDRKDCETWALKQSGVDLTKPPPAGMTEAQQTQKSQEFYRALDACLDGRGYSLR